MTLFTISQKVIFITLTKRMRQMSFKGSLIIVQTQLFTVWCTCTDSDSKAFISDFSYTLILVHMLCRTYGL